MRRVLDVARIQTIHWPSIIGWPLGILGMVLLFNVVIFAVAIDTVPSGGQAVGAIMSIYIVMLVSHLQSITQVFPLALGMSVTRRAFYAGTALVVLAQSMLFGLVLLVLNLIESATGGWGVGLRFTGPPFLVVDNMLAQWLVYTVPFVAFSAIGVFVGVVFKRWGTTGVFTMSTGSTLLFGCLAVLVTWQGWWPAVGSFFTGQPTLLLLTVYPLLIALVLGGAGWMALRRATP
jgi:hypothetical protein